MNHADGGGRPMGEGLVGVGPGRESTDPLEMQGEVALIVKAGLLSDELQRAGFSERAANDQ